MTDDSTHGGSRPNAGRKPAFGEPTKQLRIPASHVPVVQNYLSAIRRQQNAAIQLSNGMITTIASLEADSQPWAIPLMSHTIPAGFPSPAEDYIEDRIDLNTHLITHREATFILRVSGWSMVNAGIHDGDEIIVDRALNATHGNIVVAVLNNELTIKRLHKTDNDIRLIPENPEFKDILISSGEDLVIWGVVTRVLHKV